MPLTFYVNLTCSCGASAAPLAWWITFLDSGLPFCGCFSDAALALPAPAYLPYHAMARTTRPTTCYL